MSALPTSVEYEVDARPLSRLAPVSWEGALYDWEPNEPDGLFAAGASLQVIDRQGRHAAALEVSFRERVRSSQTAAVTAWDASHSVRLTLEFDIAKGVGRLHLSLQPSDSATPMQMLDVLTWCKAVRPGRQLALRGGAGAWLVAPLAIDETIPSVDGSYELAVRTLARIQRKIGNGFTMPSQLTAEQAQAVAIADQLLQGATVTGRWQGLVLDEGHAEVAAEVRKAPHGARLEMEAEHRLVLPSSAPVIGTVEYRYLQVVAEPNDPDGGLRLHPGVDDRFEIRLLRVPERTHADGTTAWVPPAMLERHAGSWVAQSGTTIVAAGDSFATVAHRVRSSGQLATIWRVPGQGEDLPAVGALL